jgi:hypothetical protein
MKEYVNDVLLFGGGGVCDVRRDFLSFPLQNLSKTTVFLSFSIFCRTFVHHFTFLQCKSFAAKFGLKSKDKTKAIFFVFGKNGSLSSVWIVN